MNTKSLILVGNRAQQCEDDDHTVQQCGDGTLIRRGVGLTMAQFMQAGGKAIALGVNFGYGGPKVPKQYIQEFFSKAESREKALDALYNDDRNNLAKHHKQLLKNCHDLLKYALPECTVRTQLVTFKILVALITRYPGIRCLFHNLKFSTKASPPAASHFQDLWNRPEPCGEEWSFYRDFAVYCLSDSGPPTKLVESELPSKFCELKLEHNLNKDPIEDLLSFCRADSPLNHEKLCAIRYLAGILELPKIWRLQTEEGINIEKRLFGFLSGLCETIFRLIQDTEPSSVTDSEGDLSPLWESARSAVDILAFATFGGFLQLHDLDQKLLSCPSQLPRIVSLLQRPKMESDFPKASSRVLQVEGILNRQQNDSLHVPLDEIIPDPPVTFPAPIISPPKGGLPTPVPADLPSQVEETLGECPRFRIVLIGASGVGKSSLVRSILNIDPNKIDVAHNRAGEADIEREYLSSENPRFILHDSKGFEAGSRVNWDTVERFLRRSQAYSELSRRIHAIWFCIETPRIGTRLLQTGDERLLVLAKALNIPVITVFTKYDLLVNQCYIRNGDQRKPRHEKIADAERQALDSFNRSVKELHAGSPMTPCVRMTNGSNQREMFNILMNVTRSRLHDVEGELWIPWAVAQQVSARQKVELSISEGFKKYWLDLGQSIAFEGQILIDCIHRIHDDALKVWNFHDPCKILSGTKFFAEVISLVKPIIEDQVNHTSQGDIVSMWASPTTIVEAKGAAALVTPLSAIGLSAMAIKYLYTKYQPYPSTTKLLATYIVNLILILHSIFMDVLPSDPPRTLSDPLVFDALTRHKADLQTRTLDDIVSTPGFSTSPEKVIASVIQKRLGFPG